MKNRLKELRTELKLSARELSKLTGIDFTIIYRIENGSRDLTLNHAVVLSDFFHVSIDYLLYRTDERSKN